MLSHYIRQRGIPCLWYLAHADNLDSILSKGILSNRAVRDAEIDHRDIADASVQRLRAYLRQTEDAGTIFPHHYVPLFFVDNTPMVYVTVKSDENVVLMEIDLGVTDSSGVLFSDGNVAARESRLYSNPLRLEELNWEILLLRYGAYSRDWKRFRSAEVLVPDHIPPKFIGTIHFQDHGALRERAAKHVEFWQRRHRNREFPWRFDFDLTNEGVQSRPLTNLLAYYPELKK